MVDLDQASSAYVFSRVTYHTPSSLQADVNIRLLGEGRGGDATIIVITSTSFHFQARFVCVCFL